MEEKIDFLFDYTRANTERLLVESSPFRFSNVFQTQYIILGGVTILILGTIIYILAVCHPTNRFLWGDYRDHYNALAKRRNFLWGTVVVAMILGVLSNLFVLNLTG
jgi:hypothetical protein